jgi:hypothetical protein
MQNKTLFFSSSSLTEITSFNEKVNDLVQVLESHATRIDEQKLRVSHISCGDWLISIGDWTQNDL